MERNPLHCGNLSHGRLLLGSPGPDLGLALGKDSAGLRGGAGAPSWPPPPAASAAQAWIRGPGTGPGEGQRRAETRGLRNDRRGSTFSKLCDFGQVTYPL